MTDGPARRVAMVLLIYMGGAWLVWLGADWFRRVLALPAVFESLLQAGLLAGVPIAALLAWKYPQLGHGDGQAESDPARRPDE